MTETGSKVSGLFCKRALTPLPWAELHLGHVSLRHLRLVTDDNR